jgi:hypothetical protein
VEPSATHLVDWPDGPRKFAGLGREATDDEIAAEEADGEDSVALVGDSWQRISRAGQQVELLSETDDNGIAGAVAWLDSRGLAWCWARPYWRESSRPRPPLSRREARAILAGPGRGTAER